MSQPNKEAEIKDGAKAAKDKESPLAVYMYVVVLTVIIGGLLSVIYNSLKGMHATNQDRAQKAAILDAVPEKSEEEILSRFKTRITKIVAVRPDGSVYDDVAKVNALPNRGLVQYADISVIDLGAEDKLKPEDRVYPLYEYTANDGKKIYIVSVRGNGLWDKIWANIALQDDLSTIAGVYFGHKGETPGLGAEIKDNAAWKELFKNKQLYQNGEFKPVNVKKKGYTANDVQAISGATVTSDGVGEMLQRGLGYYQAYFSKLKGS